MPINTRRQTLAASRPRASKPSRKSMIPRCAGSPAPSPGEGNLNRENNGRASGIAIPSPSRHGGGRQSRPPSKLAASRKSLGGAILQNGHNHNIPSSSLSSNSHTPTKNRRVVAVAPAASTTSANHGHAPSSGISSNIDPRDIKDKSYLQNAIRKMVSYLKSHGYRDASALSVKQLVNGPSGRDFQNIMTFLFRRVDPTFHQQPPTVAGSSKQQQRGDEVVLKFEDEVSMAFRCLGYPFPISKTGLVAVGSPHTWPALIAAIDWLVDVLTIRDEEEVLEWGPDETDLANEDEEDQLLAWEGSSERVEQQFIKFLRKSMVAFLNGDNEECEELEGMLLDEFQQDSEKVEAYLTGLDDECGNMREEVALLDDEVNGLSDAQQKQEEYATNIEKFLDLIQTLNDHKAELTNKVETLTLEKSTTKKEMADCTTKIEQLKQTINSQELSQEDVRRMEREKSRIDEQIAKQSSMLKGQSAALKEAEEKWLAFYQVLEQNIKEYNTMAKQVELIPKQAKHAKGNDFEIILKKDQAVDGVVSMMGGVDIAGAVKPHLKMLVEGYQYEMENEKKRIMERKHKIESTGRSREQVVDDIEAIREQITSCEEECASTKEQLESHIRGKHRQLDLLNNKISSTNDPMSVDLTIDKYNAEYKHLQLQQLKQEKEDMANKMAVAGEIRKALEMAKEYEDAKRKQLSEMNAYIEKKTKECAKIKLLDS